MNSGISDRVERFVREHVGSVEQLEVLLLLFRTAPHEWTAIAVGRELRIDPISAGRRLVDYEQRGVIAGRPGTDALVFWYDGGSAETDATIQELQRLYRERRTSLTHLILAAANPDIRVFADAFRLRKPKDR